SVFSALGLALPQATTVIQARTGVVSLAIGIGITLLAGGLAALPGTRIAPLRACVRAAFRATRIAPITAVRERATAGSTRPGRLSLPVAVVGLSLAAVVLGYGVFAELRTHVT